MKQLVLASLFLLAAATVALAQTPRVGKPLARASARPPETNAYGFPVVDAAGVEIEYTQAELRRQAAGWVEPSPVPPGSAGADAAATGGPGVLGVYAVFGNGLGASGILLSEGLAVQEIYFGGGTTTFGPDTYWQAIRHDAASGGYVQSFVSPPMTEGIQRILLGDVVGGPEEEILVLGRRGTVHVYDQGSKALISSFAVPVSFYGFDAAVADVEGDAHREILVVDRDGLRVHDGSGSELWSLAGVGGSAVVAAQMDADASLEIATSDGFVVDVDSRATQWQSPSPFGLRLTACDFDEDGMDELIAAVGFGGIRAYDVDQQALRWSIPIFDVGAIRLGDLDGDGEEELLVGEGQWGSILAYDLDTQALVGEIPNPDHGTTDVNLGDVDGDGELEVLWGAGASSTGPDHLHVADWAAQAIEWSSVHLDGPFVGTTTGDLDGDGELEIVTASRESDSGYGSGRLLVLDRDLNLLAMSQQIVGGYSWTGTGAVRLADVDGDGRPEIVVGADRLYDGVIEIYDYDPGGTFTLLWTNATRPFGSPFSSVAVGDLDGDGDLEVVGGNSHAHSGSPGRFAYVYDLGTGQLEWTSPPIPGYLVGGVEVLDADGDGFQELVAAGKGGDFYVFDGLGRTVEAVLPGPFQGMEVRPGATVPSFLLSELDGSVTSYAFDGSAYVSVGGLQLTAMGRLQGFTPGPAGSIFAGDLGVLKAVSPTGRTIWQSVDWGTPFGVDTGYLPTESGFRFVSGGLYSLVLWDVVADPRVGAGAARRRAGGLAAGR